VPTGAGATLTIDAKRFQTVGSGHWFSDSRRIAVVASDPGRPVRTFVIDAASGGITPLTPEGLGGSYVSPDERWVLIAGPRQPRRLYNLQTKAIVPFAGTEAADPPVGWAPDSQSAFFTHRDGGVLHLVRAEVASGRRTEIGTIGAAVDPSGIVQMVQPQMAADGDHFAYGVMRDLSELYLIKIQQ